MDCSLAFAAMKDGFHSVAIGIEEKGSVTVSYTHLTLPTKRIV